jgi:hypothetical protein
LVFFVAIVRAFSHARVREENKPTEPEGAPCAAARWHTRVMPEPPPDTPVLVDAHNPAWLCFVLGGTRDDRSLERVSWQQFASQIANRLAAWTADPSAAAALASTLRDTLADNPGTPVGVTWDGGLAITFSDYRAAERRLAKALADGAVRPPWR